MIAALRELKQERPHFVQKQIAQNGQKTKSGKQPDLDPGGAYGMIQKKRRQSALQEEP
jgi:hypothetical protein